MFCLLQLQAAVTYIKLQQQRVQDLGIRRELQDVLGNLLVLQRQVIRHTKSSIWLDSADLGQLY